MNSTPSAIKGKKRAHSKKKKILGIDDYVNEDFGAGRTSSLRKGGVVQEWIQELITHVYQKGRGLRYVERGRTVTAALYCKRRAKSTKRIQSVSENGDTMGNARVRIIQASLITKKYDIISMEYAGYRRRGRWEVGRKEKR